MTKRCTKCGVKKPVEAFNFSKSHSGGRYPQCKDCRSAYRATRKVETTTYNQAYRVAHKAEIAAYKAEYDPAYRAAHKKEILAQAKAYYIANKVERLACSHRYTTERKKRDSLFKFKCNVRTLIWFSFKRCGYCKSSKAATILGCTFEQFYCYYESKFTPGMNWEEVAKGNIHIDHIVPLATAQTKADVVQLCHYTNLQPLWAKDNLHKGGRRVT